MSVSATGRVDGWLVRARSLRGGLATVVVLAGLLLAAGARAQTPVQRADALLAQMTQSEKLDLVATGVAGLRRLGIPPISFIDGPNGVGEGSAGVTAFPNAVNIGASWDPELAFRFGAALGGEARAKGHTLIAAPTINIVRTPLWGRAAETLGEDPFLTSSLVASRAVSPASRFLPASRKSLDQR